MTNIPCKRCGGKLQKWNDWFFRCSQCALLVSTGKPIDIETRPAPPSNLDKYRRSVFGDGE